MGVCINESFFSFLLRFCPVLIWSLDGESRSAGLKVFLSDLWCYILFYLFIFFPFISAFSAFSFNIFLSFFFVVRFFFTCCHLVCWFFLKEGLPCLEKFMLMDGFSQVILFPLNICSH